MGVSFDLIDNVIAVWGAAPTAIIPILQEVQEQYRYLPPEIFPYMAKKLDVSEARIYGVATFYENFSLVPKGRFIVKVCDGTACHVRNSVPLLEALRKELGLSETAATTADLLFTVETVSCLGACALAPVLSVNGEVRAAMTPEKVLGLLEELKAEGGMPEAEEAVRVAG